MPVALVYVRKSVVKANKPTLSPQRQMEACVEFCREKGWEVETYADAEGHRSGRSEKGRPEWLRLKKRLEASRPGEVAAVVVYSLDRSSRSTRDFLNFLHLLQERRSDFVSVTQPYLDTTSATGRAFMGMVSIWSELEANLDSERVVADIAYRQEQGLFVGHCPIGYSRQMVDGERIPVPDENAEKVVKIWQEYAAGRHSYRSLARWINTELGLRTQGGDLWTHRHVQIMFDNHLFYRGWVTRHRKRGCTDKYKGKHPAIISDDLAEKVLSVRSEHESERLRKRRTPKYPYLLTPLLYCSECGQELRASPCHGEPSYRHFGKGCSYNYIRASVIENDVLARFNGLELPADIEYVIERELASELERHRLNREEQQKMARLEARKERAKRLFELGMRDETWLVSTVSEIDESIKQLKPGVLLPYRASALADIIRQLARLLTASEAPAELVRSMLFTIIERIETNGETVTVVQPRRWFAQFFHDCGNLYPQGNSNPCRHLERVVS